MVRGPVMDEAWGCLRSMLSGRAAQWEHQRKPKWPPGHSTQAPPCCLIQTFHSQLSPGFPLSRPSHPEPSAESLGFCQKPLSPQNSQGTARLPWCTTPCLPDFSLRFPTWPGASVVPRKVIPEHQAGDTVQLTSLWSCTVAPSRDHGGGGW